MKHCLEIKVTLTDKLGDVPPPFICLDSSSGRRHAAEKPELDLLRQ